eukprot:1373929-Rhodomonas_salina.4
MCLLPTVGAYCACHTPLGFTLTLRNCPKRSTYATCLAKSAMPYRSLVRTQPLPGTDLVYAATRCPVLT